MKIVYRVTISTRRVCVNRILSQPLQILIIWKLSEVILSQNDVEI